MRRRPLRMSRSMRMAAVPAVAVLALCGCAEISATKKGGEEPARVVEVEGTDVKRVILTPKAVERLDIRLSPVTEEAGVAVVPYAAVVYDADGKTWVYARPEPLTFVRTSVTVARIAADKAFLSAGPATGTEVVTVGTAELFGAENEIGH